MSFPHAPAGTNPIYPPSPRSQINSLTSSLMPVFAGGLSLLPNTIVLELLHLGHSHLTVLSPHAMSSLGTGFIIQNSYNGAIFYNSDNWVLTVCQALYI